MAAPRYFITAAAEPGIYLPPVGLLPPGSTFSGAEGYVPSVHARPVNDEAVEPLRQSFAAAAKRLAERLAVSHGADRFKMRAELDALVERQDAALVVLTEADIGNLRSKLFGPAYRDLP